VASETRAVWQAQAMGAVSRAMSAGERKTTCWAGASAALPALALGVLLGAGSARAQTSSPADSTTPHVRWTVDGGITAAAALGAGLVTLIPVDTSTRWRTHLLPFDRRLDGRLSASAARTSDVLGAVDVVMPLGLLLGQDGMNRDYGKRALLYVETLTVGVLLNGGSKYLVGRPRPYVYSDDPQVQAYTAHQGKDSHLSFYSGHASMTFAASVAGSYLFAQATLDHRARAAVWGFELALAGATANLRTLAGKHFYSDVIVGAVVGAAVGFAVPRLHGGPRVHLTAAEWVAIGTAPIVGAAIVQLLPAKADVTLPLRALLLPWASPNGGGLVLARTF
jgi:membrane-associated phospholipid phosphatase